jgi:predicted nuclease of predicted toxin-antitoxin system
MVELFADENFSERVLERLRSAGLDVLRVQDVGLRKASDERVLEFATAQGRAVLMRDRDDFIHLHSRVDSHEGIIVCTDDDPEVLAKKIIDVLVNKTNLKNQLIRINRSP